MTSKPTYEELEQRIKALEELEIERRRAGEILPKEESRYRTLFETANDSIFMLEDIDVKSDKDITTFELYFPITRGEISEKTLSIPIRDYKGDGETILVVDDVEIQREIACGMLDALGYKTKAVGSGEEAVEYLTEHIVDFILLDMIMDPGINDRETYERIIKIHPKQKAIIDSGFAETDEVKETQKLGAGRYIKKPFILEKIGIAIRDELKKS
jgi:CheY-like chemotaxis protein